MNKINCSDALNQIMNNDTLVIEGLSLKEFKDIYFETKRVNFPLRWIAIFLGDEVVFQPLGRSSVLLTLVSNMRNWKKIDFEFMDDSDVLMLGAVNGKYRLATFVLDFLSFGKMTIIFFAWAMIIEVGMFLLPIPAIIKIAEILITVVSIFISIFVVFSTVITPEEHFRFVEDERFSKLASTDKIICIIGLLTIIISIFGVGYGMTIDKPMLLIDLSWPKFTLAVLFSSAVMGALISFWMVTTYHFDRKTKLSEITMAKLLLRQIQAKYSSQV